MHMMYKDLELTVPVLCFLRSLQGNYLNTSFVIGKMSTKSHDFFGIFSFMDDIQEYTFKGYVNNTNSPVVPLWRNYGAWLIE